MEFLYFVVFVGALIFIHELGHFACAKAFGVRVLSFSIGFGPKIFGFKTRETEYSFRVLPFGGYVRMLEEGRGDVVAPHESSRTFEAQPLAKRACIVLAGPAMNLLFPIFLFTSVYFADSEFLAPVVGGTLPGKPADGKLLPEDVIVSIDGEMVDSAYDVQRFVAGKAERAVKIVVERQGKRVEVTLVPALEVRELEPKELGLSEKYAVLGVSHRFLAPVVGVIPGGPAERAGLASFDRIVAIGGRRIERFSELWQLLAQSRGETLIVDYMRPVPGPSVGTLAKTFVYEPRTATLTVLRGAGDGESDADLKRRTGLESTDLYLASVDPGSSEWEAGLRDGDRIVGLDGVRMRSFREVEDRLRQGKSAPHSITWIRPDGETQNATFALTREEWRDELGQVFERYSQHMHRWAPAAQDRYVPNRHLLSYSFVHGLIETRRAIEFVLYGMWGLVTGRFSLTQVSGFITLYDVAGQAGKKGTSFFVWAMATTSVNLGLVNLLPIPILDGGHLFLHLIEALRRRALPIRTREIWSLAGIVILGGLMLLALRNDVARKWSSVKSAVTEATR